MKVGLGGAATLPVVLKASVKMAAAEGDDSIGTPNRPEHAGCYVLSVDEKPGIQAIERTSG